jgi:hypothetical protein
MGHTDTNCGNPTYHAKDAIELPVGSEQLGGGMHHYATAVAERITDAQWATLADLCDAGSWSAVANFLNTTPAAPWFARLTAWHNTLALPVRLTSRADIMRRWGRLKGIDLATAVWAQP